MKEVDYLETLVTTYQSAHNGVHLRIPSTESFLNLLFLCSYREYCSLMFVIIIPTYPQF